MDFAAPLHNCTLDENEIIVLYDVLSFFIKVLVDETFNRCNLREKHAS